MEVLQERVERLRRLFAGLDQVQFYPLMADIHSSWNFADELRLAVRELLWKCLRSSYPDIGPLHEDDFLKRYAKELHALPNRTPNGRLVIQEDQQHEFDHVQDCIGRIVEALHIEPHVTKIQCPAILRVQSGWQENSADSRPYATSKLHSDIWTGEPADCATLIIPVMGDLDKSGMDFFDPIFDSYSDFVKTYTDYRDTEKIARAGNRYPCELTPNHVYAFDSFCLHRTRKQGGGIRVSIDLRIVYKDKLETDVERLAERLANYITMEEWQRVLRTTRSVLTTCKP